MWTIGADTTLFRYDPNNGSWNQIGFGDQIAAGGDGVWVIVFSDDSIWRFDSSAGGFVQVPGELKSIAVGSRAGVFGVNSSGQVFTFVRP